MSNLINTVDGSDIMHQLGCIKPLKIMLRNYNPQLVSMSSSITSIIIYPF